MIEAAFWLFGFYSPEFPYVRFLFGKKTSEIDTKVASWSKRVAKIKIGVGEQEKK